MNSTKGSLSSLAGRTIAQLRALARNSPLANVSTAANDYGPVAVATSAVAGGSEVTFLPRDPHWAHVFWELGSSDQQRAAAAGAGQPSPRPAGGGGGCPQQQVVPSPAAL